MDLPDEPIVNLLVQSPIEDILRFCSVNQQAARICSNDHLWKLLVQRDYPQIKVNLGGRKYRQFYFDIIPVEIYLDKTPLGTFRYDSAEIWNILTPFTQIMTRPWVAAYLDANGKVIGLQSKERMFYRFGPLDRIRKIVIHTRLDLPLPSSIENVISIMVRGGELELMMIAEYLSENKSDS